MPRKLRIKNTVASLLLAMALISLSQALADRGALLDDKEVEWGFEDENGYIHEETWFENDKELTWIEERSCIWDKDDLVDVDGKNPSLED